ncbi:MAG: SWIM zinc finger family protein, partial [Magnetococcales bacterium]|nr:SWIM zinc finger family protein [Magnetococcales bacterium]
MSAIKLSNLAALLTPDALRRLAGTQSFTRGHAYFTRGQVRSLLEEGETIIARVYGTREYRVRLEVEDGALKYVCTCPVGDDGDFCKHCVAVGLAWLANQQGEAKLPSAKKGKPTVTMQDVRTFLGELDKSELVEMVMTQAKEDDRLRQGLLLRAAKVHKKGLDLDVWRQAIDSAVDADDAVDYRGVSDYAQRIDEVIDSITELLKDGHAQGVIDLAEYALVAVEEAIEHVDDSDGEMGSLLNRLQEIHLRACKQAKPNPEKLAERLFSWELRSDYDVFHEAATTYAEVLGDVGLTAYRHLVKAEWAKVPALKPGADRQDRYSGHRSRITHMMEVFARQSGDVEQVLAVQQRDLSLPYRFLQVAETCKQAGQNDKALEWAEQGWKSFPGERHDSRLREFLADAYHDRHRHGEAMNLVWDDFALSPGIKGYQNLKKHADRAGQWEFWREKSIALVRERMTSAGKNKQNGTWSFQKFADRSLLVEIFLWEKDVEQAWREAKEGGCSQPLWLNLATQR